ncbi:hypothetical protein HPP92_017360 [Vanilla planifolia]|uniref:Uncharacterized protein n=1 Tax=Vanilla planifolia TaxID=51239 RepID=A0A835QF93_VANPL|nr:hypothetical protein HPP92_017360 [Vanilla planifolia]
MKCLGEEINLSKDIMRRIKLGQVMPKDDQDLNTKIHHKVVQRLIENKTRDCLKSIA